MHSLSEVTNTLLMYSLSKNIIKFGRPYIYVSVLICLLLTLNFSAIADQNIQLGDITNSNVDIEQIDKSKNPSPKTSSWWSFYLTEIISGAIGLVFGVLLWIIKRKISNRE